MWKISTLNEISESWDSSVWPNFLCVLSWSQDISACNDWWIYIEGYPRKESRCTCTHRGYSISPPLHVLRRSELKIMIYWYISHVYTWMHTIFWFLNLIFLRLLLWIFNRIKINGKNYVWCRFVEKYSAISSWFTNIIKGIIPSMQLFTMFMILV